MATIITCWKSACKKKRNLHTGHFDVGDKNRRNLPILPLSNYVFGLNNIYANYSELDKKQPRVTTRRGSSTRSSRSHEADSDESGPAFTCTKRQRAIFKARKLMHELWANQPVNLYAEKMHNKRCGRMYPHCTVCQYFVRREYWMGREPVEKLPQK